MLFRQLFDEESYTYTYLLADESKGVAALIDPVDIQVPMYLRLLRELNLNLVVALDTHVHADHITGLGLLRDACGCATMVGFEGEISCATEGLEDGKKIAVGNITINTLFTPGHTDDSFCFTVDENGQRYLFSGDTLLIRGTGRTDFQNGDPEQLYDSLHNTLLTLPGDTWVYPAHDYKGWTVSTIAEEIRTNPRLEPNNKQEFVDLMNNLNLPNPKMMDVAVPANRSCGKPEAR